MERCASDWGLDSCKVLINHNVKSNLNKKLRDQKSFMGDSMPSKSRVQKF